MKNSIHVLAALKTQSSYSSLIKVTFVQLQFCSAISSYTFKSFKVSNYKYLFPARTVR